MANPTLIQARFMRNLNIQAFNNNRIDSVSGTLSHVDINSGQIDRRTYDGTYSVRVARNSAHSGNIHTLRHSTRLTIPDVTRTVLVNLQNPLIKGEDLSIEANLVMTEMEIGFRRNTFAGIPTISGLNVVINGEPTNTTLGRVANLLRLNIMPDTAERNVQFGASPFRLVSGGFFEFADIVIRAHGIRATSGIESVVTDWRRHSTITPRVEETRFPLKMNIKTISEFFVELEFNHSGDFLTEGSDVDAAEPIIFDAELMTELQEPNSSTIRMRELDMRMVYPMYYEVVINGRSYRMDTSTFGPIGTTGENSNNFEFRQNNFLTTSTKFGDVDITERLRQLIVAGSRNLQTISFDYNGPISESPRSGDLIRIQDMFGNTLAPTFRIVKTRRQGVINPVKTVWAREVI